MYIILFVKRKIKTKKNPKPKSVQPSQVISRFSPFFMRSCFFMCCCEVKLGKSLLLPSLVDNFLILNSVIEQSIFHWLCLAPAPTSYVSQAAPTLPNVHSPSLACGKRSSYCPVFYLFSLFQAKRKEKHIYQTEGLK